MKILVLSNLYPPDVIGGYEVACQLAVDGLIDRGHEVRVLTSVPRHPVSSEPHVQRRLRLTDEWNGSVVWRTIIGERTTFTRSRLIDSHNVHELAQQLEQFRPDVVYLHNLVGVGGLGLVAALGAMRVPWVWQIGDCVPTRLCSHWDQPIPALASGFSHSVRGTYIVVSQTVWKEIKASGITLRDRVELIPYWISGRRPLPRVRVPRTDGTLRIMSAGMVSRHKGIDRLIEASAKLRDSGFDDFRVDIYGRLLDPTLRNLILEHDLSSHVRLLGPRPHRELQTIYADYDLFVFPTEEREPFGLVPLEAAAQGCLPVITSSCGVAEWLVHGVHCLKSSSTPEGLAETLRMVASANPPLEAIAQRAAEAAWNDFHIDRVLPRVERVLSETADAERMDLRPNGNLYRMARMAEQLAESWIHESLHAPPLPAEAPAGPATKRGGAA